MKMRGVMFGMIIGLSAACGSASEDVVTSGEPSFPNSVKNDASARVRELLASFGFRLADDPKLFAGKEVHARPLKITAIRGRVVSIVKRQHAEQPAIQCEVEFTWNSTMTLGNWESPVFVGLRCKELASGTTFVRKSRPIVRASGDEPGVVGVTLDAFPTQSGMYSVSVMVIGCDRPGDPLCLLDVAQETIVVRDENL